MDKLMLKEYSKRRVFLIGCISFEDMNDKRYLIKKLMEAKGVDVELIYKGVTNLVKFYIAEGVVDEHLKKDAETYAESKYRNYNNLTMKTNYQH